MKYEQPDWPKILAELMKRKGMRQIDLAKKLGQRRQALGNMIVRKDLKVPSIRTLSKGLGEDLVVHLLAKETHRILEKAMEVNVTAGGENELLKWRLEMEQMAVQIEAQKLQLENLTTEVKELRAANKSQGAELKQAETQRKQLEAKQEKELKASADEMHRLKEEIRELKYEKRLEVSVLQAKLDVLLRDQG